MTCLACGGQDLVKAGNSSMNVPKWALNPPELCALGTQKMRNDLGAAKDIAESKGRASLSRQLESKVKSMIKNYNQEGGNTEGDISESLSTSVSKELSKQTLNGSIPKKTNLVDGQVYTLVCLAPNAFTQAFNDMKTLNKVQRAQLTKRAEMADEELEEAMKTYAEMN